MPHTFLLGGDITGMIRHGAGTLAHVHLADAFDHRASSRLRYIVNPLASPVRVHQHVEIRSGGVAWDAPFGALREVRFDGILTSHMLASQERAEASCRLMNETIAGHLARHPAR